MSLRPIEWSQMAPKWMIDCSGAIGCVFFVVKSTKYCPVDCTFFLLKCGVPWEQSSTALYLHDSILFYSNTRQIQTCITSMATNNPEINSVCSSAALIASPLEQAGGVSLQMPHPVPRIHPEPTRCTWPVPLHAVSQDQDVYWKHQYDTRRRFTYSFSQRQLVPVGSVQIALLAQ